MKKILSKNKVFSNPVICIGNIYLGGTGKTPLAIKVSKLLEKKNKNSAIIKKKYKSHFDEVELIRKNSVKLFENEKRETAISAAINSGHDYIIMDDGLQDFNIKAGLNIVCFNTKQLIGNGLVLPAGPLREDLNSISRCQIVVLNGKKNEVFESKLKSINKDVNIFYTKYTLENAENLKYEKILCFAGIGNPNNFFEILKENGLNVIKELSFPDHYTFKKKDMDYIYELSKKLDLKIVTTEKDYFRLRKVGFKNIDFLKVKLDIENEEEFLKNIMGHF